MRYFILIITLTISTCVKGQLIKNIGATQVLIEEVVDSSESYAPWDVEWGADGRLWYTDGPKINVYDPIKDTIIHLVSEAKGNFLGLAVSDSMSVRPYVFAVYDTACYYSSGYLAKVFRYEYSTTGDSLFNDTLLLEYFHAGEHSGGRLIITQDNKLLLTTADYWHSLDTLGFLKGKVLRMNLDGSVPSDNPRADLTYSFGHRNAQGLTQIANGNIYVSEHGQAGNNELNWIKKGKDYGWPVYDGTTCIGLIPDSCSSPTYTYEKPIHIHFLPAPSGLIYYNFPVIPELDSCMLIGGLWGTGELLAWKLNSNGDSVTKSDKYFPNTFFRIRDLCSDPAGNIYLIGQDRKNLDNSCNPFVDSDARIYRISPLINPGLAEQDLASAEVMVYPNPTNSIINIVVRKTPQDLLIKVTQIDGKELLVKQTNSEKNIIDLSPFSNGVYLITVLDLGGQVLAGKYVVKNNLSY